jgi:excisionase family DNA binding protein
MTINEVANHLRLSRVAVLKKLQSGEIKSTKIKHGKVEYWRISEEQLEEFLDE